MKRFDHIKAESYEEASQIIREGKGAVEPMAGGTDLLGTLKDGLLPAYPEAVVSLKKIPDSAYIREEDGMLAIGAGTTLKQLEEDGLVRERCAALAEAAHSVASPLIRNTATIGGNICQDVRCWYYRYPDSIGGRLVCKRKGGDTCYAIAGENRYHSIFGGMCTGGSSCQNACPAGTDIAGYMAKIREGDWDGAAKAFFRYNPMPMMTSRVCPHLCTEHCNQNVYGESVNIPAVERTLGDYILEHREDFYQGPEKESGKRCAVIGAGPGGLTAAFYLRKAGHQVTVYDAHEKAGGVLRYGIPHYRLPKTIVDAFCDALAENMGVRFVLGTTVGKDITVEQIKAEADAVYFGTGAWSRPVLGLEGENLTQFGLDLLEEVNTYLKKAIGEQVLVCGGGNVAMDVALTARRLGAKSVKLVCLEQREEMPASAEEIRMALEEGVEIVNGWGLKKVLEENGKVKGLLAKRCLSVRDEKGRFAPRYEEADTLELASDFIILATGQKVDIGFLGERLAVQLKTARGLIDASLESGRTKTEGYYAGGDAVTGPDLAIRAIAAGRNAAFTMDRDLCGGKEGCSALAEDKVTGCEVAGDKEDGCAERFTTFDVEGVERVEANKVRELPAGQRTLTGEDRGSLDQETAKKEASRCLHCACYAVAPSDITPVLVMADARIVTTERVLSAKELFTTKLTVQDVLHDGELVKEIRVPAGEGGADGRDESRGRWESHYDKRRVRDAIDFAIVSLASTFQVEDGAVKSCRLVLGGVAPVPYELPKVEAYLTGKKITPEVATEAGKIAMEHAFAMSGNEYKIFMCKDAIYSRLMGLAG